jgi:DNA-binding transcriptional LysR family regulator
VCAPAVAQGDLEVLLPEWSAPEGIMHFVYPTRRGLLPAVRALVDLLAERLPEASRLQHNECRKRAI